MLDLVRSPRALRAARLAIAVLVVGAFALALFAQLGNLSNYDWKLAPEYVAAAALVALGRGVPVVYPWWRIVRAWGQPLAWWRAVRLYFISGLMRYLPGQWWFVLGRAYLAEREGVPKAVTAASTAVETVMLTGSALAVALLGGATVPAWAGYAPYLAALGLLAFFLLLISPLLVRRLPGKALERITRYVPSLTGLTVADAAQVLLGCAANWLMYGLIAVFLLVGLSGGEHLGQTPAVIGLFSASVLGGSIGLLVPQGMVIREGVLVYLFHSLLGIPVPVGIAVAALTRLVAMAAEGAWALVSLRVGETYSNSGY